MNRQKQKPSAASSRNNKPHGRGKVQHQSKRAMTSSARSKPTTKKSTKTASKAYTQSKSRAIHTTRTKRAEHLSSQAATKQQQHLALHKTPVQTRSKPVQQTQLRSLSSTSPRQLAANKQALESQRQFLTNELAKLFPLQQTLAPSLSTSSTTTTTSSPLQTISSRDITTTIPPSFLQSPLLKSNHAAVRSLAASKLTLTPHSQQLTQSSLDLVPVFTPLRNFAADKKAAAPAKAKAGIKKKPEIEEAEGGDDAFAQAGDVKKNLRNWLEQILTSKPVIEEMPQSAIDNEELFVKECQTRFAQRLDQRSRFEQAKIILKQRAIEQLPGELKTAALKEDPALWSMQIMTPWSDPPRKKWLMEHYRIPYKASQEEIDEEEFLKKKYARL